MTPSARLRLAKREHNDAVSRLIATLPSKVGWYEADRECDRTFERLRAAWLLEKEDGR